MLKAWLRATLSAFMCLCAVAAAAQADTATVLREVEVLRQPQPAVSRDRHGGLVVRASSLGRLTHTLGETDAIIASTWMPGVNTGGDYGSGVSVNGADYSQCIYTMDGATVFAPYRFGGIFTAFNPMHITTVRVSARQDLAAPYAAGALYEVDVPSCLPSRWRASANIGVLASSAAADVPVGSRTAVRSSARLSYLNMLYGGLLDNGDNDVRYGFGDYNLTLVRRLDDACALRVNAFCTLDRLRFDDAHYSLGTRLRWHNQGVSVRYEATGSTHLIAYSAMESRLSFGLSRLDLSMPSSVSQLAASGQWASMPIQIGYRLEYNSCRPQRVRSQGVIAVSGVSHRYESWLGAVGVAKGLPIGRCGQLHARLRLSLYGSGAYRHIGIDPMVAYTRDLGEGSIEVSLSVARQYMHQAGFSDIGLASNFYVPAMRRVPAQHSCNADIVYRWRPSAMMPLTVDAHAYASYVTDVPEYTGGLLAVLADGYDPMASIIDAYGYNVGADVTLSASMGALSGWVGYGYGMCRRRFADDADVWAYSAYSPGHSIKALAAWHVSAPLTLSAHLAVSSGRPYTPVCSVFMVGGNVITEYAGRNSARLPAYHRLDLSATYTLRAMRVGTRMVDSHVNVSVINAYCHDNIEMQYYIYDTQHNTIRLRQLRSIFRFMPSVSYTVDF